MKTKKYSVIIIGSGISGLYTALKIQQQIKTPDGIAVITKNKLNNSNSYYAQGGMVAVLEENKSDSIDLHVSDTLYAGVGLCDEKIVKIISENSDNVIKDLISFGVSFDRDENGKFALTKEAAHSVNRILHSAGDATGREIENALCNAVKKNKNIDIFEDSMVVELLTDKDKNCCGVILLDDDFKAAYSPVTIIATGGIGQLYKYTTNPIGATADGISLAYKAGAILRDMEFVQFHPTALAIDDKKNKNRFLISEAVRGEGAKLTDINGVEFMQKYHPQKELAPRDIVARANFLEMTKNNVQNVYLNATVINHEKLLKRFPTINKKCLENGIDITKDFIPVAPAAHYFMGGIKTDEFGRTNINGLFAIGEAASTGLHGANRLASNSLLECVVCAYKVAQYLKDYPICQVEEKIFKSIFEKYELPKTQARYGIEVLKEKLKDTMWRNAGIFRSENSLKTALYEIDEIKNDFCKKLVYNTKEEYEFNNMLIVSQIIVKSALNRNESRGAHYRQDYPNTGEICRHSLIKNIEGEISFVE